MAEKPLRRWLVGSVVALLALAATFVQTTPADAATHVGIGEPRVISTTISTTGGSATLGVHVRSAKNVEQVRIYLFLTAPRNDKRTVIGQLSKGTSRDGYWTGTTTFADGEGGGWRIGKVRVLGSHNTLLKSKAIAKNTAAMFVLDTDDPAVVANVRTRGPERARTAKVAFQVASETTGWAQDLPVLVSVELRRPSGKTFVRSINTRTDEDGKGVVTFGPYRVTRVRALVLNYQLPDGGFTSQFFDLR